jgi:hypothetical protein
MLTLLLILLTVAVMYLYYTKYICPDNCGGRSCGSCRSCKAEAFRHRRQDSSFDEYNPYLTSLPTSNPSDPNASNVNYIRETNVQDTIEPGQANVSAVNTGIPYYFQAYGSEFSYAPSQGDPGAVAPFAQYVDLYNASQKLGNLFGPFQVNSQYKVGGAISDLFMAKEEHDNLQYELTGYRPVEM